MKYFKKKLMSLGIVLCLVAPNVIADDTDLYLNPLVPTANPPIVMFTLDYRSNIMNVAKCTFTTDISECGWTANFNAAFSAADKADNKITFFETLKASLKIVLQPLDGVKVGFLMNHDDGANNCVGNNSPGTGLSGSPKCSNGGYIMQGVRLFDALDSNGAKSSLLNKLDNMPTGAGASHPYQGVELFFELFRYLTGQGIHNAHNGWVDYGSNNADNLPVDFPIITWDTSIEDSSGVRYQSPLVGLAGCQHSLFTINFLFQVSNNDGESNNDIKDTKANGGVGSAIDFSGALSAGGEFSRFIKFLYDVDLADNSWGAVGDLPGKQNVVSYFIVDSGNVNQKTKDYASKGGTALPIAIQANPESLVAILKNVFNQILSVSTTFTSSSVPVNVFNRSQFIDELFMAIFKADGNAKPFWGGNLKKLALKEDTTTGDVFIVDAYSNNALDPLTGRITSSALTLWSDATGYDVVGFNPTEGEITGRDGRSVDRGGSGQRIPSFLTGSPGTANSGTPVAAGPRRVLAEPPGVFPGISGYYAHVWQTSTAANGTATALVDLNADDTTAAKYFPYMNDLGQVQSVTATAPGSGTVLYGAMPWLWDTGTGLPYKDWNNLSMTQKGDLREILAHVRGNDVDDLDSDTDTTDARRWLMGDPLHSKPLPINYGALGGHSASNPDIRLIVTGNDGQVRMFKNTTSAGNEDGMEVWTFIPTDSMGLLKRLRDNGVWSDPNIPIHPYGVDGEAVVYVDDVNHDGTISKTAGDKVILYFGMRRGGTSYYALDISDPDDPKMLWKINKYAGSFAEMGMTFSTPKKGFMNYDGTGIRPVLIFGGGYSYIKDLRMTTPAPDDINWGNAIYIVDALDGSLVWKAVQGTTTTLPNATPTIFRHTGLLDAIPAEVAAIDTSNDGLIDRIYVPDTGGNVWRADVVSVGGSDNRANWSLVKFANLGRHSGTTSNNDDRRFFHGIDVVKTGDAYGSYDAVILESGDRANPLDRFISPASKLPVNYLYMLKDRNITSSVTGLAQASYTTLVDNSSTDGIADVTDNCFQEEGVTCTASQVSLLQKGWKIELEVGPGEKGLSKPLTFSNTIFYTTFVPPSNTGCVPTEGQGIVYAINLQNGGAALNYDSTNTTSSGEELQKTDRHINAGVGIAPGVVVIGTNSKGQTVLKTPGGNQIIDKSNSYKTFWISQELN